jgi:hypothetical protein
VAVVFQARPDFDVPRMGPASGASAAGFCETCTMGVAGFTGSCGARVMSEALAFMLHVSLWGKYSI